MNIPEEMILRIKDDKQIRSTAYLEAEITYLKLQSKTHQQTEVYLRLPGAAARQKRFVYICDGVRRTSR